MGHGTWEVEKTFVGRPDYDAFISDCSSKPVHGRGLALTV